MLDTLNSFIERMTTDGLPKQAERLQETLQKKVSIVVHVLVVVRVLINDPIKD